MSIKTMARVWEESQHDGSSLLLLLSLADHASDDGVCWPGLTRLARLIRRDRRYVRRLIRDTLEPSGELYVARQAGRGNTNLYYVTIGFTKDEIEHTLVKRLGVNPDQAGDVAATIIARQKGVYQAPLFPQKKGAPSTLKGGAQEQKGAPSTLKGGLQTPRTIMNHHENPQEPSPDDLSGEALLDQHFGPRPERESIQPATRNIADPVQAGGAHSPAETIVHGICTYNGLSSIDTLPKKKRASWIRHVAEILEQWGGATVEQARLAWQAWTVHYAWRDSANPFYKTFDSELGQLLIAVREGAITTESLRTLADKNNGGSKNATNQRIIEKPLAGPTDPDQIARQRAQLRAHRSSPSPLQGESRDEGPTDD